MYRDHRERYLARLEQESAAALVASGSEKRRNGDSDFRFRPESDFWYLTGFAEPDSVLVLLPRSGQQRSVLFLRERDPAAETWTGRRLGVERACAGLGVDQAYPIGELWTRLPELLEGHETLVYASGLDEKRDQEMIALLGRLRTIERRGKTAPASWTDPSRLLHEQRLRKSAAEIATMRSGAEVTGEAHRAAMRAARPGGNEREIDALLSYTFKSRGATGEAYTNIVAGGASACCLHYHENDRPLVEGELLLVDAGAEWDYYATDVTRTFPVGGRFLPHQRQLYEVVLAAQLAAIEQAAPGNSFDSVHQAALEVLARGLVGLGLLEGPPESVLEQQSYRRFYMHRTSHWLGLDVHDCGRYTLHSASRALEPGMVLTVEPGLYVAADDAEVDARWRGIGIRIEDDVLVTQSGREVLTAGIPKDPDEVEAACRAR